MWTGSRPKSVNPGTNTISYIHTDTNDINTGKTKDTLLVIAHMVDFVCVCNVEDYY